MIALYLPPAWTALIPTILIEAGFGIRRFGIPARHALFAQTAANGISTIVGLPITWLILALVEGIFFGTAAGLGSPAWRIYAVTVQSPWLIPYESEFWWMVPASLAVLTVPFYLMSVFSERLVLARFFPGLPPRVIKSWTWGSNLVSYTFLLVVLAAAQAWPTAFQWMFKLFYPVSNALVYLVFMLASLIAGG